MNEIYLNIAKLGLAHGEAKCAYEYAEGVFEGTEDAEQKTAAAVAMVANRRSMSKTAEAFGILSKSLQG